MQFKNYPVVVLFILMFCLSLIPASSAHAWRIPDTGQTKCYDNDKEIIPCPKPGEPFYGQDGNYTINPMSYTKLDDQGKDLPDEAETWAMVRDNVTGLIWENKQGKDGRKNYADPHDGDNTYTWYDSNPETNGGDAGWKGDGITSFDTEQFIKALNAAGYGGYRDWRMPTIKEMASLVDYRIPYPGPTINIKYFTNTVASWYWSATAGANYTSNAWIMGFGNGHDGYDSRDDSYYVRAVRGGQTGLLDHLVINGDGTVTDTETGLIWQRDTSDSIFLWKDALSTCENLNLANYTDWRVPTEKELRSLVDYRIPYPGPVINTIAFPNTAASWYWSATADAYSTYGAWLMDFDDGSGNNDGKVNGGYVRAVRGGQSGSLGHLVISAPSQGSRWAIGDTLPIRWNTEGLGAAIKISLSRQGGKDATFDPIISSTPNDGEYDWTVTGPASVNCVIKIEQADNPANWATEGMFTIQEKAGPVDTDNDGIPNDIETAGCTDPNNSETDGDGLPDGVEDANHNGTLDAGEINPCNPDTDGDGLTDGQEDVNHNGKVDTGERNPNLRDMNFNADSAVLMNNAYMPLSLGSIFQYEGTGTWNGHGRYIKGLAVQTIDGVNCLKIVIKGQGNHFDPEQDPEWVYLWLAEDTSGCVWMFKFYEAMTDQSATFTKANALLMMPANPVIGQKFYVSATTYKEIIETNVTVPRLGTGYGPFSDCLKVKKVTHSGADEDMLYHKPGVGLVWIEENDHDAINGWELIEPGGQAKPMISAGHQFTLALNADGTVKAKGVNDVGQCNVEAWRDIRHISAGFRHSLGVTKNRTVVHAGDNTNHQCDVDAWQDIIEVSAGDRHSVGLKSDGTVTAIGDDTDRQCDVGAWRDIVHVAAGGAHTLGLRKDGTVLAVGKNNDGDGQCNVEAWQNIIQVDAGLGHSLGLTGDGRVEARGLNDFGQCNTSGWADIVQIAAGSSLSIGYKGNCRFMACGKNVDGMNLPGLCEAGKASALGKTDAAADDIMRWIAAGDDHVVGMRADGTLAAQGDNTEGQCDVAGEDLLPGPELPAPPILTGLTLTVQNPASGNFENYRLYISQSPDMANAYPVIVTPDTGDTTRIFLPAVLPASTSPLHIQVSAQNADGFEGGRSSVFTITNGDLNNDGTVGLDDLIIALKIIAGMKPPECVNPILDADGNGKIGMAEVLYLLQIMVGVR